MNNKNNHLNISNNYSFQDLYRISYLGNHENHEQESGPQIDLDEIQRRSTLKEKNFKINLDDLADEPSSVTEHNNGYNTNFSSDYSNTDGANLYNINSNFLFNSNANSSREANSNTHRQDPSFHMPSGSTANKGFSKGFTQIEIPSMDDDFDALNFSSNTTAISSTNEGFSFPTASQDSNDITFRNSAIGLSRKPSITRNASITKNNNNLQSLATINTSNTQEVRKVLATELKTPAEYTLHMIFTQFIRLSERKLSSSSTKETILSEKYLNSIKPGSDRVLDKVIIELGYIAKKQPQKVIESVLVWRKSKNDQLENAINVYSKHRSTLNSKRTFFSNNSATSNSNKQHKHNPSKISLHSRNISNQSSGLATTTSNNTINNNDLSSQYLENQVEHSKQILIQMENISNISSYLVCRVLIEIIKEFPLNRKTMQIFNNLEDNVYNQLISMNPQQVLSVNIKLNTWKILVNLLGEISKKRFARISDKFIAQIEKLPPSSSSNLSNISKTDETSICLMIQGMCGLELSNYPLEEFEESCGFLSSYVKFFSIATNSSILNSYCETLAKLLIPLGGALSAETDLPVWVDIVTQINAKTSIMINRAKYWDSAFTLLCVCLCVSPARLFNDIWFDTILTNLTSKLYGNSKNILKESPNSDFYLNFQFKLDEIRVSSQNANMQIPKIVLLRSLARLIWTYVFRNTESLNKTTKKLDAIFKILLFTAAKKISWIQNVSTITSTPSLLPTSSSSSISTLSSSSTSSSSSSNLQPFLDWKLLQPVIMVIRYVAFSNINYSMESVFIPLLKNSFNLTSLENLHFEKLMLCIKAYILTLEDCVLGERPDFPTNEELSYSYAEEYLFKKGRVNLNNVNLRHLLETTNVDSNIMLYHDEMARVLTKLFLLLDKEVGMTNWIDYNSPPVNGSVDPIIDNVKSNSSSEGNQGISISRGNSFTSSLKNTDSGLNAQRSISNNQSPTNTGNANNGGNNPASFLSSKFSKFSSDSSHQQSVRRKKHQTYVIIFEELIKVSSWTFDILKDSNKTNTKNFKGDTGDILIEILTRNCIHENSTISAAAKTTLLRLCYQKNPSDILDIFGKFAFSFSFTERSTKKRMKASYLTANSIQYETLLQVYYDMLLSWLDYLRSTLSSTAGNLGDTVGGANGGGSDFYILNGNFKMNLNNKKATKESGKDTSINDCTKGKKFMNKVFEDDDEFHIVLTALENLESHGLFFLCSRSTTVRRFAISLLKVIIKFDDILQTHKVNVVEYKRLIQIIENISFFDLVSSLKSQLSVPEKKTLAAFKSQKSRAKDSLLVKLAEADNGVELTLWFKVLPKVLTVILDKKPYTMNLTRVVVTYRINQIFEYISNFATVKHSNVSTGDSHSLLLLIATPGNSSKLFFSNSAKQLSDVQPEILVEQWRLYLIFICISLNPPGQQVIASASALFKMVIPLLSTEQQLISDSINTGLSCINANIFKTFVDVIKPIRISWDMEMKSKSISDSSMRVRIEITRILHATSRLFSDELIYNDSKVLREMVLFIKTVRTFLGSPVVQESFEYQKLRRYFCGLLENLYKGVLKASNPDEWFPFEARLGCLAFLEEWCGYGISSDVAKQRYATMKMDKKYQNIPTFAAAIELEKVALDYSAVSCMATLCQGTINQTVKGNQSLVVMAIDYTSLLSWMQALLESDDDLLHKLGKRALKNLLSYNHDKTVFNYAVQGFYSSSSGDCKVSENYFLVISEFLIDNFSFPVKYQEVIVLALYGCMSLSIDTRKMAGKLLVYAEERFGGTSLISSKVESVYTISKLIFKNCAVDASRKMSKIASKLTYKVFSLFCFYLHKAGSRESQESILSLMIPWLESVNLSPINFEVRNKFVITEDDIDANTQMIMNNLIEITQKFGEIYYEEVNMLWSSLINANPQQNAMVVLDYALSICLYKRNSSVVELLKKIVNIVYSQYTGIIETLITNINSKAMIPPDFMPVGQTKSDLPYVYDMNQSLVGNDLFSLGQISTIFIVDLFKIKFSNTIAVAHLPELLNISFLLFDHYLPIVRSHALELLCTILTSLSFANNKAKQIVENLRKPDNLKYVWIYDDLNNDRSGSRTPRNMDHLICSVVDIFKNKFGTLQEEWGKVALVWATTCSVRHLACRSFQAFRSLLCTLDRVMLRDMLHRLSNTISDPASDIQGFAMQILMSLNAVTAELDSAKLIAFPQLFWSAVACLGTIHEKEFIEVLSIIAKFISKIDLNSQDTISCLVSTFPTAWEGKFEGIQNIIMTGLRSSVSWEHSLKLLDRINKLQYSEVIASPSRLLLAFLANMPRFLHALEEQEFTEEIIDAANILSGMALAENQNNISRIVLSLANNKFRKKEDFISQALYLIREVYFPEYQSQCLVFMLGLLMNKIKWVKLETLELLKYLIPMIDFTTDEFQGVGADLLSPLLRLLLTEYSTKALSVLDEANNISGSRLDKDFIRLSLGNRTLRKEYEKIATLFGVPEDSGWSIPMPAVTAATTRNNVHAVYLTCKVNTNNNSNNYANEASSSTLTKAHSANVSNSSATVPFNEQSVQFYDEARAHPKTSENNINNIYATLNYFELFFDDADGEDEHEVDDITSHADLYSIYAHERTSSTETSRINQLVGGDLNMNHTTFGR